MLMEPVCWVRTEKEREIEFEEHAQKLIHKIKTLEEEGVVLEQKCNETKEEIETASERLNSLKESSRRFLLK